MRVCNCTVGVHKVTCVSLVPYKIALCVWWGSPLGQCEAVAMGQTEGGGESNFDQFC